MCKETLQKDISSKKPPASPVEADKDFIGEMTDRINNPAGIDNETEAEKKMQIDEQESDGSANAFETK
ncbi:hypothetical protein [Agriterribacter sp.]|uniref:hypothetical protein n=1 Tax=Agriterribacter sp. TaxID=2821509 RepID=UPI002C6C12E2|nr:hypothetical protein [Agriterribacter sp.]HTN06802.1 hypothetical protein [Agriterribacter sp.]